MKRISNLSLIAAAIIMISLLFHACNKQNGGSRTSMTVKQSDELIAKTKELIGTQIKKHGIPITYPVNEKLESHWADSSGHTYSQAQLEQMVNRVHHGTISDAITSLCDFSNVPSVTLLSYTVTNDCINGYTVSWTFQVSSNNNIVSANGTTTSKGFLRVFNGATQVYSANVTPATVTDQGVDPLNAGYELFNVSFTSGFVPNSDPYITPTGTSNVKLGGFFVTNCSDLEPITAGVQAYTLTSFPFPAGQPCTRIDPVYINPGTGKTLTVFGEDPLGTCTDPAYVYPSWQEVQYSENGGSTWATAHLSYNVSGCPFANFIGKQYVDPFGIAFLVYDYSSLTPTGVAHAVLFRHRDVYYTSAGTTSCSGTIVQFPLPPSWGACEGSWSTPVSFNVTP